MCDFCISNRGIVKIRLFRSFVEKINANLDLKKNQDAPEPEQVPEIRSLLGTLLWHLHKLEARSRHNQGGRLPVLYQNVRARNNRRTIGSEARSVELNVLLTALLANNFVSNIL